MLSEENAEATALRLDKTKAFFESVRPFNTPGKFKNFTYNSEQVRRLGAGVGGAIRCPGAPGNRARGPGGDGLVLRYSRGGPARRSRVGGGRNGGEAECADTIA